MDALKNNVHIANILKRIKKPSKRSRLAFDSLLSVAQSRLAQFLLVLIVAVTLAAIRGYWILLIIPAAIFGYLWRSLVFEFFVLEHAVEAQLGLFQWYSVVDDNLLLGAIPMQENHIEEFQKLGVSVVVSIVQPWEFYHHTMFGDPVTPEIWRRLGVEHVLLPSPDFLPPPFEVLEKGATVLDRYLSENKRVYVHCKSGVGRSASVILAYFLKFKNEDFMSLYNKLKARRGVIFGPNSAQMKNMIAFAQHLRPGSKVL